MRAVAMRLDLVTPKYWPTWFGLGVLRALELLPYSLQRHVGFTLGSLDQHALAQLDTVTVRRPGLEDVYVHLLGRPPSP